MCDAGPPIEQLTRRLAETPEDFLSPVLHGNRGSVNLAAIVSDVVRDLGGEPLSAEDAKRFQSNHKGDTPRLSLTLIAAWLLHDSWFREKQRFGPAARRFLESGLDATAALVKPEKFVTDPDRREELARLTLAALDLVPSGETEAQAGDRLTTLSSVERQRIVAETRAAQERIKKIQEAMKQKAAEEAAPAWGRE